MTTRTLWTPQPLNSKYYKPKESISCKGARWRLKKRKYTKTMKRLEIAAIILGELMAADKTYDKSTPELITLALKTAEELIEADKKFGK